MSEKIEFVRLKSVEKKRTYHYSEGRFSIDNVAAICVRPSGTHRLETTEGKKYVVRPGWLAVEIDTPEWTF